MGDMLPTAFIEGMQDTRGWTEAIAARLVAEPPLPAPAWVQRPNGLRALEWHQRGSRETIVVSLIPHPERVAIEVWTSQWEPHLDISYDAYADLVRWIAWTLIHPDPEAGALRLVVQSYRDVQAELEGDSLRGDVA